MPFEISRVETDTLIDDEDVVTEFLSTFIALEISVHVFYASSIADIIGLASGSSRYSDDSNSLMFERISEILSVNSSRFARTKAFSKKVSRNFNDLAFNSKFAASAVYY